MATAKKAWPLRTLVWAVAGLASMAFAEEATVDAFLSVPPLSPEQLGDASGRQGVPFQLQLNDNQQSAAVSDNILSGNVLTGNNSISDHAFEHMSGIATVIQNTGNQVVIQDSTMINVLINQ